jgi:hypothetical protein
VPARVAIGLRLAHALSINQSAYRAKSNEERKSRRCYDRPGALRCWIVRWRSPYDQQRVSTIQPPRVAADGNFFKQSRASSEPTSVWRPSTSVPQLPEPAFEALHRSRRAAILRRDLPIRQFLGGTAELAANAHGQTGAPPSPAVSGRAQIKFAFWTACPAAPLPRLSTTPIAITRLRSGSAA